MTNDECNIDKYSAFQFCNYSGQVGNRLKSFDPDIDMY